MDKLSIAALLTILQCGAPAQQEIRYPLYGHAADIAPFTSRNGWDVTLSEARVALGPIYFCTTEAASPDLCEVAQAELATSAVVDATNTGLQELGEVRGFTGTVGSAQYDFGISWTATQSNPTVLTHSVDGHSAHFAGTARRGMTTIRFALDVDLVPRDQGTRVVQGAKTGADIQDEHVKVVATLDPVAWFRQVDFAEFENSTESVVQIDPDSVAANAVIIGMTASAPPRFEWSPR